jgi:integrase/recombinase XerC
MDLQGDGKHHLLKFGLNWDGTRSKLRALCADLDQRRFRPEDWGLTGVSPNSLGLRLEEWITKIEAIPDKDMAPGTKPMYGSHARRIADTSIANMDIRELDTEDYEAMFAELPGRNTTKKTTRAALRTFLTWCRRKRYILNIPLLPTIKANDAKPKYVLTVEQQEEALARLPEERRDLYRLMMRNGARVSEILTLQIRDVNLDRKTLTICRTWSGRKIKPAPKTNKPRVLPMTDTAAEIIKRNIGGKIGKSYIWSQPDGSPYTPHDISGEWTELSGFNAPLKDATRRSYATHMRNAGVDIDVIRAALGHTTVLTTQKYLDDDVEWARDILNKAEVKTMKARNERETAGTGYK